MLRPFLIVVLSSLFVVPTASAVVYCKSVGVPKGCVAAPGRGAPGVGTVDPGINQPGAAGNVGVPRAGVGAPGVGVGAPGAGVVDPGINQPGAAGNVGVPGNRGGPVNRVGPR
jgi:hypothetical protein